MTNSQSRRKILVVSQSFAPDEVRGAELVAASIASRLATRHAVSILALGDAGGKTQTQTGEVHRLRYQRPPRPGAKGLELGAVQKVLWHANNAVGGVNKAELMTLLCQISPDVVHVHNAAGFQPQLYRACADLSLPVVQHLHDYVAVCPRTTMYRKGRNCDRPCTSCRLLTGAWRRAARTVGDVIAVSDFVRRRHQDFGFFAGAKWHVVHNVDRTGLDDYIAKSGGPYTFGFIGALTPEKGVADLVAAFGEAAISGARMIIAGRGEELSVARLKARAGDAVSWLGQVPPNSFYSQIDCLVVPSRWHEPQALVVAEGLRRGLPIIASRRGGNTEVLENTPPHLLYEPEEHGALRRALAEMSGTGRIAPMELNPNHFEQIEEVLIRAAERSAADAKG